MVGPLAGVFVDRWEKRQTMISMAALQAIFAVLLVLPAANFSLPLIGRVQLPLFWRLGVVYTDVVLLAIFAQFFIPAQFALIYFFITGNLHAPASDYGLLGADFGVGAIAGAVLVTSLGQRIGLARILWIALVTSGLFVIVMSHLTSLYPALVAAFLFGVSTTAVIVTAGPLTLDSTSREFVGRVTAVINPLGRLAALVSIALAGFRVSTVLRGFHASVLGIAFGPVDTVFTGLGLLAVIGGIYARVSLRSMIGRPMPSSGEPSPGLTGAEGGTQQ